MRTALEFFRLREKPFSLTPDLDFFCEFDQYEALIKGLTHNVLTGEGLVVVTAEIGLGKTMVCRKFLHILEDMGNVKTVYIPNPKLDATALLSSIVTQLDAEEYEGDPGQLTNHINAQLIECARQGKKVICVIDEAQVMEAEALETLRLLTNLETQKRKLIQIFLFGQPELVNLLDRESLRQIRQRISHIYTIRPLTFPECYQYVCRRLIVAGHPDGAILTRGAHRELYKQSRGVPRVINILLDKALTAASEQSKKQIDLKTIKKVMGISSNLAQKKASNFDILKSLVIATAIIFLCGLFFYDIFGDFK